MSDIVIVSAARTPVGSFCSAFATVAPADLGDIAIKEALLRASVKPEDVSEVILGQVFTAGQGQNPARQAAMKAGIPIEVPAYSVNMLCGSGLKTVALGFQSISNGDSTIVVAGGQESMSTAPHVLNVRQPSKFGDKTMVDTMLKDGLIDAFNGYHMGITAENVSKKYNISREEQDQFSLKSQHKAAAAQAEGRFSEEIVGVPVTDHRKNTVIVSDDEYIRKGATIESIAKLRPAFDKQ
eukprot:Ihof_evm7s230 gene=Ihof_evmTU7s230